MHNVKELQEHRSEATVRIVIHQVTTISEPMTKGQPFLLNKNSKSLEIKHYLKFYKTHTEYFQIGSYIRHYIQCTTVEDRKKAITKKKVINTLLVHTHEPKTYQK